MSELSWTSQKIVINTDLASLLVLGGHRHIATNLPSGVTAEREAQAFWEVRGHDSQNVSEFLGPWNGISCILRPFLPSPHVAVPLEPTQDTVSENTCVAHQVYKCL